MKNWNDKSGYSYFFTLSFAIILMVLSGGIQFGASVHSNLAKRQSDMEEAFLKAEAGINVALGALVATSFYSDPFNGTTNSSAVSGAEISMVNKCPREAWDITSVGYSSDDKVKRQITILGAQPGGPETFARSNEINGSIWDIPGDDFHGDVYWGDKPYIAIFSSYDSGTPRYFENAYTKSSTIRTSGPNNNHTFKKGIEMDTELEAPNRSVNWNYLKATSKTSGNLFLQGSTYVKMNGSSMQVWNSNKWGNYYKTLPINDDQLMYVEGNVYIQDNGSGNILNGEMTIVSTGDVRLREHIKYADDPTTGDKKSDDYFGLIAKDDIWIDTSAPDNIKLHGAFLASGAYGGNYGTFGVIDYNEGSPRGNINLLGSLVQDKRGAVGQFSWSSGQSIHGYSKNFNQDPRFGKKDSNGCRQAPPYYPIIPENISIDRWDEGPVI